MRGWLNDQFRGDFRALGERRVLGAAVHDRRAFACAGSTFFDSGYTTFLTTEQPEPQLPARQPPGSARRVRTVQEFGRRRHAASICGRSCCHSWASILGMVSKPVTSRSIWRSALLISVARRGVRHARAPTAARASGRAASGRPGAGRRRHPHDGSGQRRTRRAVAIAGGADRRGRRRRPSSRALRGRTRRRDRARGRDRDAGPDRRALPPLRARRRPRERSRCARSARRRRP